eukprot:scaffold1064_cov209-Skeletonema_marinoi.AAC.10
MSPLLLLRNQSIIYGLCGWFAKEVLLGEGFGRGILGFSNRGIRCNRSPSDPPVCMYLKKDLAERSQFLLPILAPDTATILALSCSPETHIVKEECECA